MSLTMAMHPVPFPQGPTQFPHGGLTYPAFSSSLPVPSSHGPQPSEDASKPPEGAGPIFHEQARGGLPQQLPWNKGKRPGRTAMGRPPLAAPSQHAKKQNNWSGWRAKRRRLESNIPGQQVEYLGTANVTDFQHRGRPLAGPLQFNRQWAFQPERAAAPRGLVQQNQRVSGDANPPRLIDLAKKNKQRARRYYKKSNRNRNKAPHDNMPDAPRNTNSFLMRSRLKGPVAVDSPVAPAVLQAPPLPSQDWPQERPKESWAADAEALDVNPYGSMSGVIRMKLTETSEATGLEDDVVDKDERGDSEDSEEGSSGSEESDADANSVQRFEQRMDQGLSRFELNYNGANVQVGEGEWEAGMLRHRLSEVEEDNMKLEEDNMNLREKLFLAENLIRELQRRLSRTSAGSSLAPSVDSRGSGGASFAVGALYPQHFSSASEEGASSGGNYLGLEYAERADQMCSPADALCAPGDVDEDADSRQPASLQQPSNVVPDAVVDAGPSDDRKADLLDSAKADVESVEAGVENASVGFTNR